MKPLKLVMIALLVGNFANFASAEIISWNPYIDVEYKYYNVAGNSVKGIRASIQKNTTVKWGRNKIASKSEITSRMQYKYRKTASLCFMKQGRAYNKVVQTLPKLTGSAAPALKKKFDAYVVALKKYERTGLDFRVKAAQEVQKYYSTDPKFNCSGFTDSIENETSKIYKSWDKKLGKYLRSNSRPKFK